MKRALALLFGLAACTSADPVPRPAGASAPNAVMTEERADAAPSGLGGVASGHVEPAPVPAAPECELDSAARVALEGTSDVSATVALGRVAARTFAFVADEDAGALRTFEVDAGRELAPVALGGAPSALLVTGDGRIYVALADTSRVAVLEARSDAPPLMRCDVAVAPEPTGLALAAGGARLLVVSRWGHALETWRTRDMVRERRVELARDPVSVVPSRDGSEAWVLHLVGGRLSRVDAAGDAVRELPLAWDVVERDTFEAPMSMRADATPSDDPGVRAARVIADSTYGMARMPDGRVLVASAMMAPGASDAPSSGYGGGGIAAARGGLVVVSPDARAAWTSGGSRAARSDDECLLPRALALDPAHDLALVACLGDDLVVGYETKGEFVHGLEHFAVKVPAGPTGIAVDAFAPRAVVWSQFERALSVFLLRHVPIENMPAVAPRLPLVRRIDVARPEGEGELAQGRRLFHAAGDRRIARDGRSCASCHPGGRDDGLTWRTPEGPRQTPMLLERLNDSGPYGWDGGQPSLEAHLGRTLARLGGGGLDAPERAALFAYVGALRVPPSWRADAAEVADSAPAVARGRELFEGACAACHVAGASDGHVHDVASRGARDLTADFDTPSLRSIGRSAPYFHDGRYPTLGALLAASDSSMAATSAWPASDIAALLAYLSAL